MTTRKFTRGIGSIVLLALCGCTQRSLAVLEVKNLALNPREFVGKAFLLQGRVTKPSPGFVTFVMEDETGSVLVTTEKIGYKFNCPAGSRATIAGHVARDSVRDSVYFSAERVEACQPSRSGSY